ncbi:MAG: hypothetical protein MUF13_00410 [Akkermansiaceae bacterium]|nr:hypothetical protein [Akkermansiaceae bacterium]
MARREFEMPVSKAFQHWKIHGPLWKHDGELEVGFSDQLEPGNAPEFRRARISDKRMVFLPFSSSVP